MLTKQSNGKKNTYPGNYVYNKGYCVKIGRAILF